MRLRLGSLGSPDARAAYREELQAYLRAHEAELAPEVVRAHRPQPAARLRRRPPRHAPRDGAALRGCSTRWRPTTPSTSPPVRALLDAAGLGLRGRHDARARARLLHAHGVRVHLRRARRAVRRRRRRPLRRADRADRRPARRRAWAGRRASSACCWPRPRSRPRPRRVDLYVAYAGAVAPRGGLPAGRRRAARGATRQDSNSAAGRSRVSSSRPTAPVPATLPSSATRARRSRTWRRESSARWSRTRSCTHIRAGVVRPPSENRYRDAWCGELSAAREGETVRVVGLGAPPARPRRADLRRPARPLGHRPARLPPRVGRRGARAGPAAARRSTSSRPRARWCAARRATSTRTSPRARSSSTCARPRSSPSRPRRRSRSTRTARWTRRCACATACSTCGAPGCATRCCCATRSCARSATTSARTTSSRWRRRSSRAPRRRARATSSSPAASARATSTRCRSRRSSSSSS